MDSCITEEDAQSSIFMNITEQIVCFAFGGAILWLTFRLVRKEKFAFAIFAFIAALICFSCGLTWVQGLMKTQIISVVTSTLKEYGKKLDDFQNTTTNIQAELDQHQAQINGQQRELKTQQVEIGKAQTNIITQQGNIARQYVEVQSLQKNLDDTETNISQQQKRLEDVEFLVKNLFSKMTTEHILGNDSNLVKVLQFTNGASQVFIMLQNSAIHMSVQCIVQPRNTGQYPLIGKLSYANVFSCYFGPNSNPRDMTFDLTYVLDTQETNRIKNVTFDGTKAFFDGQHVPLAQDRDSGGH